MSASSFIARWRWLRMLAVLTVLFATFARSHAVLADNTPQSLPFSQDWANTGLITANDDWSGVPGVIGYRGDGLVSSTAVDPQTVIADGSATPIDVNPNQTNPNTFTTGGVTEFEITNPTIALQGSGTADAPHIILHINTTSQSSIAVAYNLRDIDGSADNAVQPVALQYRVGSSGNFTNIPAGFVADATTGPSLATLVTAVSATLPAAANNQPEVQIRVITTDAVGSDEWVGIDDTAITGTPIAGDDAPAVDSTTPAGGATNVALDANITITFSEPVSVTGSAFTIECPTGTPITFTNTTGSGPATTFTLDATGDLPDGTTCTVTVVADQVSDQDADDPPDNLAANYSFSFTTLTTPVASPLVINEIDYDQPSTDAAEFIEIRNNDSASVNLDLYSLQLVNGNAGGAAIYQTIDLPNVSLAVGDYYVVCANTATVTNCDLDVTPDTNLIQNGAPDAVALLFNGTIIDTISYEGNTGAPYTESSGAGVEDDGVQASESISRCPDGADTNQNNIDFSRRTSTPGAANICAVADTAPSVTGTSPSNGATGIAQNANIDITFSEPVAVTGSWFSISCANSGAHTATVGGGLTTFTLNPDTDFAASETCTVTVTANLVSDQDSNDPPDTMDADFIFSFTTAAVPVCGDPATLIHAIQGSGLLSPLNGATVTIEGIVVGDYQGSGQFSGYHVQEEDADADADPATSEGIFVFNTSFPVNAGDKVRVTGRVTEFETSGGSGVFLTELGNVSSAVVCSTDNSVAPTPVTLPVASLNDLERYESMLVNFPQQLTVTENFTLGRFGEVSLSVGGRLPNPTNIVAPGAPAIARQALNDRSRIVLDDGNGQQNIDPTIYPAGGLSATNTLRDGYTVNSLTGVLEQRFSVYRVQPVGPIAFNPDNPRTAGPAPVGGTLKVAAMNVLNFFTTLDTGTPICGPTGGLDCRGANSAFEFTRQRDKIINAALTIDADVIGLMEVQNDASATIQNLVDGLNDGAGPGTYAFINTGTIGTDAIKVAIIYKPASVTPVGSFAILDSSVDPLFIDTKNRPSLAQTFEQNATGAKLTVVVNHLKSKGSDCNDVGDPDTGDGQGNCNVTRTNAATALVNWLATDPTGSGDPDFLIVGDMNSYALEDPITTIKNAGYTNLINSFVGADAYSFVFQGQSGYLDHALASTSLTSQVTGVAEWHNNADEPTVLDYNVEFKTANQINTFYSSAPYRASDHDPLVVGLNLQHPNRPPVADNQSVSTNEDTAKSITLSASDADGDNLTYIVVSGPMHGALSGTGASRIYTPAPNYNGPDSFTFKASDGQADSNVATVSITVNPVNDVPTIAVTAGGQCLADFRGQANLVVGDVETALGSLALSGSSSNTTLVPNANITFDGSGANRTVTIATAPGKSGSATVTLLVNDGTATAMITIGVKAGTSNNDSLTGSSGSDMLFAGNAQDTLNGGDGNDLLCSGQGDDRLTGGLGDDTLDGGSGQDQLDGGAGNDALRGGQGDDRLTGGSGADHFDGGPGNDTATDFNAGEGDTKTNIP